MNLVNRMTLTADGKGAIFDVPSEHVHKFIKGAGASGGWGGGSNTAWSYHDIAVPTSLPPPVPPPLLCLQRASMASP